MGMGRLGTMAINVLYIPLITAGFVAIPQCFLGLAAWYNARAAKATAEENLRIMRGNGKGNVTKMLENSIAWQERHEVSDNIQFDEMRRNHKRLERKVNLVLKTLSPQSTPDSPSDSGHSGETRSADTAS